MQNYLKGKRGFTIIEIMVSVALFSVVLLMTFETVNTVPKLVKQQTNQFGERTDVRQAIIDMTQSIQNAAVIRSVGGNAQFEFEQADSKVISYEMLDSKVIRNTDANTWTIMNSVEEFTISQLDSFNFGVHIKTKDEGKTYDFKVNIRNKGIVVTGAEISSISPTSVTFNKTAPADQTITLNLNGNSFNNILNGNFSLTDGVHYTVNGDEYTILASYLSGLANGHLFLTFDVSTGVDPVLDIDIQGSFDTIMGNANGDDTVSVKYPDNTSIAYFDKTWTLTVTSGTVRAGVNINDLTITGLPPGLTATAAKGAGNTIVITVAGTAASAVNEDLINGIGITILSSAVTEFGKLASSPISVSLLTGYIPNVPEYNILYTNEFVINNNATITGDVFLGRNAVTAYIHNNSEIYGNIYCASNLTVSNNAEFGKPGQPVQVFIKGNPTFYGHAQLYGDLYYEGNWWQYNDINVTGITRQMAVEFPDISIPSLKPDQWYIDNGYTVINNAWTDVTIEDNGKYFFNFTGQYAFNDVMPDATNFRIATKGSIVFNKKFTGSGVIFAPNGTVTVNNKYDFTGICISSKTILNNSCTLVYQSYPDLPY